MVRGLGDGGRLDSALDLADAELLERFVLRRDEVAFEAILHRHGPLVFGVCRRLLDVHDAEDAFQATFLVLARRAGHIARPSFLGNWLYGRAIQRAFEIEHSTAIYSGLLRMADLLALQPNMNIALHIVAPAARRDKVLNEVRRPVFSLLENQPLAQRCTFIAYEDLREIMSLKHLSHLSDSVLEEYEEAAYE